MKKSVLRIATAMIAIALSSGAYSEVCDYRLSSLVGGGVTATVGATSLLAGKGMTAMGYYTLTHAVTGATMLGSTLAGSSGAGTIGIIAGTGTGAGAVGAALMSSIGIVIGVVVAGSLAGSEVYCYFQDERITDYDEVLLLMKGLAANADPASFEIREPNDEATQRASVLMTDAEGVTTQYWVGNLYINNGKLRNRDWFWNTVIGNVGLEVVPRGDQAEE